MRARSIGSLVFLALLFCSTLWLYSPAMGIPYFGDDSQYVFPHPETRFVPHFLHRHQRNLLYRPLESFLLSRIQARFGLNPVPVHSVQILLHASLSCLVFLCMRRRNSSRVQAAIASIFMTAAQANVLAVASLDTLSQVGATLFGFAALCPLLAAPFAGGRNPQTESNAGPNRLLWLSPVLLALSLFFKESGLSYVAMVGAGMLVLEWRREPVRIRVPRLVARMAPLFAVAVLYLLMRAQAAPGGPRFGPGGYDLHVGANIPKNLFLLSVGGWIPVSSVRVFESLSSGDVLRGSAMLAAGLVFALLVAFGLWRSGLGERRLHVAPVVLLVVAFFPMAIMNHVSELHVYNAMPFFAMLAGAGLGGLLGRRELAGAGRTLPWAVLTFFLFSHVLAVREKVRLMAENGERATRLLQAVVPFVDFVPSGGTLFLVNPHPLGPEYSVFRMTGFNVLGHGLHRIPELTGRADLKVRILGPAEAGSLAAPGPCLLLGLREGEVLPHPRNETLCPRK